MLHPLSTSSRRTTAFSPIRRGGRRWYPATGPAHVASGEVSLFAFGSLGGYALNLSVTLVTCCVRLAAPLPQRLGRFAFAAVGIVLIFRPSRGSQSPTFSATGSAGFEPTHREFNSPPPNHRSGGARRPTEINSIHFHRKLSSLPWPDQLNYQMEGISGADHSWRRPRLRSNPR